MVARAWNSAQEAVTEDCCKSEASLHLSVRLSSKGRQDKQHKCGKQTDTWQNEEIPVRRLSELCFLGLGVGGRCS